jgi:L-threonylcarbamoyladenylate synthase
MNDALVAGIPDAQSVALANAGHSVWMDEPDALAIPGALVDAAVAALRRGKPIVMPFDTVYGLAADPYHSDHARGLYEVKGRPNLQPTALVARDVDYLLECVPELRGRAATFARLLLPGPVTLVLANPARRFRWLTGDNPDTIGVRVPELAGAGAEILARVGALAATSANQPGKPDPSTVAAVPPEIRSRVGAVVDGGELPGTPSTVIDLSGPTPLILREGALPATEALRRLESPVRSK